MAGFLEVHEVGGGSAFIDAGAFCGLRYAGMPDTTASKDQPIEMMLRGQPSVMVLGVTPVMLMAQIAYTRQIAKDAQRPPMFVLFKDGIEWDVEVKVRRDAQEG